MATKRRITVRNATTGQTRQVAQPSMRHLERVTYGNVFDTCTGPCRCNPLEQDGTCPNGWPSKSLAAGII